MKSKVTELGVFAIGIGVLIAVVVLVVANSVLPPQPPMSGPQLVLPLGICGAFIVLGALTLILKNRVIILITVALLVLGLVLDLAIGFNPIKLLISGAIIWLIIKTGKEAAQEVNKGATETV